MAKPALEYESSIAPRSITPRRPIVELLLLAGPTVAQMLSYTLMQFIDTLLLARIGVAEAAAAANAGLFSFALISFGVGVMYVVNTLVSQSFGAGEHRRCGPYLWQGIWFSILFAIVLLPLIPIAMPFFEAVGHEPRMVLLETTYLRIMLALSGLKLIGTALAQFLLAINRPGAVFIASVIGVGINVVAAWAMLFGKLGFEPMGVAGAAWAQNIGIAVETLLLFAFALTPRVKAQFQTLDWRMRLREMKVLLRIGVPAGVAFIADVLAWSMFSMWIMGLFGTNAMAANNFMMRYMVVSFMPAFGIASAVTALVGRYIGMGRPDLAVQRAHLGFILTGIYMMSCGLFFYLGRDLLIGVFADDPEIRRLGAMLLTFAAVYQLFDAMYIIYNGALRGAGDTFIPAIVTASLCWGINVFGGYLVARHWRDFGPAGPWTVATIYGVILGVFMFVRFRRGGWKTIHLEPQPGFEVIAPATV